MNVIDMFFAGLGFIRGRKSGTEEKIGCYWFGKSASYVNGPKGISPMKNERRDQKNIANPAVSNRDEVED